MPKETKETEFELKEIPLEETPLTEYLPEDPNNPYNLLKFDRTQLGTGLDTAGISIKSLINPYKVLITYSYSSSENQHIKKMSHKICGHNFEAFELLEKYPNSLLLIPDDLKMATKIIQAFFIKYKKEVVKRLLPRIVYGRPLFITSETVVICDGQLPTNVIFRSGFVQFILCSKELYWTKNSSNILGFKPGDTPEIQLAFDGRLGYQVTRYIHEIITNNPQNITVRINENYRKELNFDLYNEPTPLEQMHLPPVAHTYLLYVTGNCRDLNKADTKNQSDTLQEVIDLIKIDKTNLPGYTPIEIMVVGLNMGNCRNVSNGPAHEKNENPDYCEFADGLLAKFNANGLDVWLEIYPESMLPIHNFFDKFQTYIYTPTEKNWDCSSRLIPECKQFNKRLLLTETVKKNIEGNPALKYRVMDYYGTDYDFTTKPTENQQK